MRNHRATGWQIQKRIRGDFPGGSVVKTPCFHFRGSQRTGQRTKILQTVWHSQKKK